MKPITAEFMIVNPDEFPDGLLCGICKREILDGQPYTDAIEGMQGDNVVALLVCVYH